MFVNESAQRLLIWIMIVSAVLFGVGFIGLTGLFPPPSPSASADEVMHLYADHNIMTRIGVVLCIVAGGFNAPWTAVLTIQIARLEKGAPIWAVTQAIGGTLSTILFPLPAIFWGVAAFSADRAPELTLMMHELAFLTLVTPVSFFFLQALPIAIVSLTSRQDEKNAFPRWIGYLSIWIIATAELGVLAQLFHSGPFAWNGLFTFWLPLTMFGIWIASINFTMLRALRNQERDRKTA